MPKLFPQTICELTPISYTSKCINMQYLDSELMCYSMFYLKHCILSKYINFEFFRPDTERLVPTLLIVGFYSSSTQSYEVPNNKYIKLLNSLWNISSFTLEYHWVIVAFIKLKKNNSYAQWCNSREHILNCHFHEFN